MDPARMLIGRQILILAPSFISTISKPFNRSSLLFQKPVGKIEGHFFLVKLLWIISHLVGRLNPSPCCPGKKADAEAKKGPELPSRLPPVRFRKQKRRKRDARAETAEARYGKRAISAFFDEAYAFWPGHGTLWK